MDHKVKFSQALAFMEACCGLEGEERLRPKSVAVRTHLEAVLGQDRLPNQDAGDGYEVREREDARMKAFAEYLIAVGQGLISGRAARREAEQKDPFGDYQQYD